MMHKLFHFANGNTIKVYLALLVAMFTALIGNTVFLVEDHAPRIEVGGNNNVVIAPSTGIEGYDTALFCNDPLTSVLAVPNPDALGTTYQLKRVRDMKTETVVVVMGTGADVKIATHYYDTTAGQQSEPAVVTKAARDCIEEKAKVR